MSTTDFIAVFTQKQIGVGWRNLKIIPGTFVCKNDNPASSEAVLFCGIHSHCWFYFPCHRRVFPFQDNRANFPPRNESCQPYLKPLYAIHWRYLSFMLLLALKLGDGGCHHCLDGLPYCLFSFRLHPPALPHLFLLVPITYHEYCLQQTESSLTNPQILLPLHTVITIKYPFWRPLSGKVNLDRVWGGIDEVS